MLSQTILPFELEISEEKLTAHGGLALVAECAEGFGLRRDFETCLPTVGRNRGHDAWTFGRAALLMLHGGGRTMEDMRTLATDEALRDTLGQRNDAWTELPGDLGPGQIAEAVTNVTTLNWRLYNTAAKLVRHAGAVILKLSGTASRLPTSIRACAKSRQVHSTAIGIPT